MGVGVYFPEDIRNAIVAANEAATQTARILPTQERELYLRCYRAALVTLSLAFGLSSTIVAPDVLQIPVLMEG